MLKRKYAADISQRLTAFYKKYSKHILNFVRKNNIRLQVHEQHQEYVTTNSYLAILTNTMWKIIMSISHPTISALRGFFKKCIN